MSNSFIRTTLTYNLPEKDRFSFWSYLDNNKDLFIACEILNEEGKEIQFPPPHFQLGRCSDTVQLKRRGFVILDLPPFTRRLFNVLEESGSHALGLNVVATISDVYSRELEIQSASGAPRKVLVGGFQDQTSQRRTEVLSKTPGTFYIVPSHAERPLVSRNPFFYQDESRSFFIAPRGKYAGGFAGPIDDLTMEPNTTHLELPDIITLGVARSLIALGTGTASAPQMAPALMLPAHWETSLFHFENFYHPYVCLLIEQLNRHGIDGILRPDPEQEPPPRRLLVKELRRQGKSESFFNDMYVPNDESVVNVYKLSDNEKTQAGPLEEFDFSYGGAYSIYNWELFFHAPFMLAKRLSANQRFAEAHRWFHYIFDPTNITIRTLARTSLADQTVLRAWHRQINRASDAAAQIERFEQEATR